MGRDKALIELFGKTLLERVADCLSGIFSDILIVGNTLERFREFSYPCVADEKNTLGPMGGLETALHSVKNETIFLAACDMPFLHAGVIQSMIDSSKGEDLLIPKLSGRLHPLHALYTKNCLPVIEKRIKEGNLALHCLSNAVKTRFYPESIFQKIDPSFLSVMNLNTQEDLEKARQLLERGRDGLG